ncbi:ethanolamine utilization protein EutN [Klebsiella pneumoniae]|nr:ethanolamine utilization protein EutN [Klebsiella pneumoniae]
MLVSGSSARQAHAHGASPVDLCVIGIVDEAAADGQVLFHKSVSYTHLTLPTILRV